ncbi:hypothetical protein BGZ61DRAFT_487301 [Ilyonectria robusta]|uniref:uncharacterized protein n=1 Tax=Ilyonectria robusta TaxID=1079257 RepID=UPI001E8E5900|nr:uncharacterized protein BGZ61DRAFT_487301 [Ilyonectria robusta]KAH8652997.1 hypothetical protein BGZ61DRAFT_487301 [Ilyonectria robusta]
MACVVGSRQFSPKEVRLAGLHDAEQPEVGTGKVLDFESTDANYWRIVGSEILVVEAVRRGRLVRPTICRAANDRDSIYRNNVSPILLESVGMTGHLADELAHLLANQHTQVRADDLVHKVVADNEMIAAGDAGEARDVIAFFVGDRWRSGKAPSLEAKWVNMCRLRRLWFLMLG